jgi:hypothetical protein
MSSLKFSIQKKVAVIIGKKDLMKGISGQAE